MVVQFYIPTMVKIYTSLSPVDAFATPLPPQGSRSSRKTGGGGGVKHSGRGERGVNHSSADCKQYTNLAPIDMKIGQSDHIVLSQVVPAWG